MRLWRVKLRLMEINWTAELGIPFSQLRFDKSDNMTWGMNVGRGVRKNNEESDMGAGP